MRSASEPDAANRVAFDAKERMRSADRAESVPYHQRRAMRKHGVRARTINVSRLPMREIASGRRLMSMLDDEEALPTRPLTRGECADVPRPCPFVSCVHHLYLDVSDTGGLKLNFPDLDPGDLPSSRSCALDIADDGGITLEAVGEAMNVTRERVRQIEIRALARIKAASEMLEEHDLGTRTPARRHLPILDD